MGEQIVLKSEKAFERAAFVQVRPMKCEEYYPQFVARDELTRSEFSKMQARRGFNKLKLARERRGLSQSELARAADVNVRNIQLYEQGVNDIRKAHAEVVLRLSKALYYSVKSIV